MLTFKFPFLLQYGKDVSKCAEMLQSELDRISNNKGHLNRRRSSLHQLHSNSKTADDVNVNSRRNSVPEALTSELFECVDNKAPAELDLARKEEDLPIPTVVLTPGTPRELDDRPKQKTLFQPVTDDIYILGKTASITASCLDIETTEDDILNNNSIVDNLTRGGGHDNINNDNEEDNASVASSGGESVCSLSTTTLSRGELRLIRRGQEATPISTAAFTTIRRNTLTMSNSDPSSLKKTSTTKTVFHGKPASSNVSTHYHSNLCPENPFRKVFAQRKAFYQAIGRKEIAVSSVNRLLWRKRHCTLCCAENRACSDIQNEENNQNVGQSNNSSSSNSSGGGGNRRITLNANIQPFAPFTITHDGNINEAPEVTVKDTNGGAGIIRTTSSSSDLFKDGKELRYATSTINSEDGVESHLEISVGQDGSSVITTRHKRLGSPSEISNNSVLQVHYDEDGGKVFNIQQSQQKLFHRQLEAPPPQPQHHHHQHLHHPPKANSAYCTTTNPPHNFVLHNDEDYDLYTRYNSLPNMYGSRPVINCEMVEFPNGENNNNNNGQWLYFSHPADEEKRLAFTRGQYIYLNLLNVDIG